jgi:ketosteroid isomerase-like protein
LIFLSLVLSACNTDAQNDTGSTAVNHAEEKETLMALERKWSDLYGQRNVDGIAELLAEKSVLLVPGQPPAVGRDSVLALTRDLIAGEAADGVSVSWEPEAVFVSSSGDMAYDYGRSMTKLADGTVIEGSYLVVWTKEEGGWKVAADIFN